MFAAISMVDGWEVGEGVVVFCWGSIMRWINKTHNKQYVIEEKNLFSQSTRSPNLFEISPRPFTVTTSPIQNRGEFNSFEFQPSNPYNFAPNAQSSRINPFDSLSYEVSFQIAFNFTTKNFVCRLSHAAEKKNMNRKKNCFRVSPVLTRLTYSNKYVLNSTF